LLSAEKVKTYYTPVLVAEHTVQQQEAPQPPPDPEEGIGDEKPESEAEEQQKADMTLLTSREEHLGHSVSLSAELIVLNRENFSLHIEQTYS
jgi:hypothetical protein